LDSQNESRRIRLFGLPIGKYRTMLEAQGGGCAICGGQNRGGSRRLAVDHDHSCCPGERTCGKCVRGLLCDTCNHGIGNFKDSEKLLQAALSYLKR